MADTAQAVADKQAITEQLYRYCRSVDRLDVPLGHSVFHEDATADYGPSSYKGSGRGAIDYICKAHLNLKAHSHQVTNVLIELDGESAASEAYVMAALRGEREGKPFQLQVWARYCDTWSRRDGHWAIDHRNAVIDFDTMSEVTPVHEHDWTRRDREDPSYAILKGL
ncbi:nuclear transport factor 2 family protein [Novosphingobium sp. RD2P27]|uniref:Nuclear transport factor 2 family protein n=1 Tax=Novosphingobium kalidii TaxID=3230299 RepID=A0ABV2D2M8_9SPHN